MFDEATSNLDSQNEKKIVDELGSILKGKTVIFCAHRLTSITGVDKIIVVGDGKVIEEGNHDQLISQIDSNYAKYWHDFLGKFEL